MTSDNPGEPDDMGEQLLAVHPRGAQWLQLDVTVASLIFDQLEHLGELTAAAPDLATVRAQLIASITDDELAGRLASRWVRWAAMFGLPQPDLTTSPTSVLQHPGHRLRPAHPARAGVAAPRP